MQAWLELGLGNPSSLNAEGRRAKNRLDEAREQVAASLDADFGSIVFTSSGTEAAAHALIGLARENQQGTRRRILMSASEHHAMLNQQPVLEALGFRVEIVPVDRYARIDLDALRDALGDDVLALAVMHANNELGTINPIESALAMAKDRGVTTIVDMVQTYLTRSTFPLDLADLALVSAHKVGGPTGVGALRVRPGVLIQPLIAGGGQERDLRGGTENVVGIVGFGAAVGASGDPESRAQHQLQCRAAFLAELPSDGIVRTVPEREPTLPGHLHLRIPGHSAEGLLIRLDREGIAASSGAACSSGSVEPSHVLLACGYSAAESREGLRFTFGRAVSIEQSREAGRILARIHGEL